MIELNKNAIIASGLEMSNAGLSVENTDDLVLLWIKWRLDEKEETFFPFTEIYFTKPDNATHKVSGQEIYMILPPNPNNGNIMFGNFLKQFLDIEEL